MKRALAILLSLIMGVAIAEAGERSYAYLKGDTLVVGNSLIERTFLWNDGALITRKVLNKKSGAKLYSGSRLPDFVFLSGKHNPSDAHLECVEVEQTAVKPAHLLVSVRYSLGNLDVRREFRVYDDVPAIACDTYLRGHAAKSGKPQVSVMSRTDAAGQDSSQLFRTGKGTCWCSERPPRSLSFLSRRGFLTVVRPPSNPYAAVAMHSSAVRVAAV